MPTRHMLRQRTDACRRRRVAFFILPLDGEPMESSADPGGRAWHERADAALDPLTAPEPQLQLGMPLH